MASSKVEPRPRGKIGSVQVLLNQMLMEAVQSRATDICLEPSDEDFVVSYTVDEACREAPVTRAFRNVRTPVTRQLKEMAGLDPNEWCASQVGRLALRSSHFHMMIAVTSLPTPAGECFVLHLQVAPHA